MVAVAVAAGGVELTTVGVSVVAIAFAVVVTGAITGAVPAIVTANIVMPDAMRVGGVDGVDGADGVEAAVAVVAVSVIVADDGATRGIAASGPGVSGVDVRTTLAARAMVGRAREVLCTAETAR